VDTNKTRSMSRTLLLMAFILSFYFIFTGELKIGNSAGLQNSFEFLTFAENPLEHLITIGFIIGIGTSLLVLRNFLY
jgi:hypothetical protein